MTSIWVMAIGIALVAALGFAVDARRARRARRRLEAERDALDKRRAELERALSGARATLESERAARARAEQRAQEFEIRRNMREELESVVAPLVRGDRALEVASAVRGALAPMMESAELAAAFSRLKAGRGLVDLPPLLEAIASSGGFATVLLSDDSGLLVAANKSSHRADDSSGLFALMLAMADRMVRGGAHAPRALLVHDDDNQITVHRIFRAGGERYLLSAVTRRRVGPDVLDAALPSLMATLARHAA